MTRENVLAKLAVRIKKDTDEFRILRKDCKHYKLDPEWNEWSCCHGDIPIICHGMICPLTIKKGDD